MGAPDRKHRPQYGWDRVTFFNDETLGEPGGVLPSESQIVERPNGLYRVTVAGRVESGASSGIGRFGYYLEGSNTGGSASAEWFVIAETNLSELFTVGGPPSLQARVLGFTGGFVAGEGFNGEAQVSVDRWRFLRIRTFVEVEDPPPDNVSFTMTMRMTGIAADGQLTNNTSTLTRTSGDTTEPFSAPIKKPEGVRYLSAQLIVDSMILDIPPGIGVGFEFILQVAQNQNAVNNDRWLDFDEVGPFDTAGENAFFANGQTRLIDLNGFQHYRFKASKASVPPGDISSFTVRCISVFDDADWIDGEQGIVLLNENIRKTFVQLVFDPATSLGGNNREIRMQICDMNQVPIRAVRRMGLLLANSIHGFTDDLNGVATFTSVTGPAVLDYGAGNNVAVVRTDEDGTATIQINTGAAAPLFIVGWNGWIPSSPSYSTFGPGQVLIATLRASLNAPFGIV
jgi:hypothetical protein